MISFSQFLVMVSQNPFLAIVIALVLGTIFVNGATDAANAIAEPVGTRSIGVNAAIAMSVVCNFVGLVAMTFVSTAVADTVSGMVDFGGDTHAALIALAAATVGIVAWGVGAWIFGIPTSESHALIAGLTGGAMAVSGGLGGVNVGEWMKVIYGLVLSTVLGYAAGWGIAKVIPVLCKNANRRRANDFFGRMQVVGAAGVALMHGAQDGQKFMSTAMLAVALSQGLGAADMGGFPLWIEVMCAGCMAFGTAMGGRAETFSGLTGIGDLIVTCASMHSRNRRAGILIGQGKTYEEAMAEVKQVVEGVYSAKAAVALGKQYNVELPIITEVSRILFEGKPAADGVRDLMLRDRKVEINDLDWSHT